MTHWFRAAPLACIAFSGCALIDQTTFAPEPDPPAPAPKVAAAPGPTTIADTRLPLMTIRYDVPSPNYATVLPIAVRTAQERRPGIGFDVVAIVGSVADAAQGQVDASEIARSIGRQAARGTPVLLGLRIDPAAKVREVRIYPHAPA